MNYLGGVDDPYSEDDSSEASSPKRPRMLLGVLIVLIGLIGSTFAANISLNSGTRKEFGQGIFQIKACDQWVGVGMVSGASTENDKVKSMKLYGFDPRLCLGRVFNLRVFTTGDATPLKLYVDDSATAPSGVESATALGLIDTSTAYSSNYVGPAGTGYDAWAAAAVKVKTLQGFDIYSNSRIGIRYDKTLGTYTITFATPLALVTAVNSVTIESACYSPGNCR